MGDRKSPIPKVVGPLPSMALGLWLYILNGTDPKHFRKTQKPWIASGEASAIQQSWLWRCGIWLVKSFLVGFSLRLRERFWNDFGIEAMIRFFLSIHFFFKLGPPDRPEILHHKPWFFLTTGVLVQPLDLQVLGLNCHGWAVVPLQKFRSLNWFNINGFVKRWI